MQNNIASVPVASVAVRKRQRFLSTRIESQGGQFIIKKDQGTGYSIFHAAETEKRNPDLCPSVPQNSTETGQKVQSATTTLLCEN